MSCSSENIQSKTAKGDHLYAFSPLPQEDDSRISSFSIEMPPSSTQPHESISPESVSYSHDSEFSSSQDNEPACAVYAKLTFIALVIAYNIFTYNLPSPTVVLDPNSFSISNFTIFYSRLAANWKADFTFRCKNCGDNLTSDNDPIRVYYDQIKGYIFYYGGFKDLLSTVSIEPFNLGAKEHKKVHVKFGHTGWEGNQPIVRTEVANEIGKQVERGVLHLGVRLDMWVTYRKWGSLWKGKIDS